MRLLLVVLAVLALAPAALAGPVLDRAAQALESSPVYVDPAATKTLTERQADALRAEIRARGDGPIYVAVLPSAALDEAGGGATGIIDALHTQLGAPGVYAVVAGGQFRAAATDLGRGVAGELATKAYDAHHAEGIAPTLMDFVDRVGDQRRGGGDSGGGSSFGGFGLLPLLLLAGLLFFGYRAFARRRRQQTDVKAVKEAAREDLIALAEDVQELEHRVEADPAAKRDYMSALDGYSEASSRFDRARTPEQLAAVAEALEQGRYAMACAEARLENRKLPERRPPCFFDPRHGPSVRDVAWSPNGGAPREIPACAACAQQLEDGYEPASRQVAVGGAVMPYWAAGPMFGGYFGGFFPGFLLGEMIGGFGPFGWGGPLMGGFGGYDTSIGGDFGGGDIGGGMGDFGGGDFGGGGGGGDF
jgi:hypothetical protein